MREFVPISSFNALQRIKPMQHATLFIQSMGRVSAYKSLVFDVLNDRTFAVSIPAPHMDADTFALPEPGTTSVELEHSTGLYRLDVHVVKYSKDGVGEWILEIQPPARKVQERDFFRVDSKIKTTVRKLVRIENDPEADPKTKPAVTTTPDSAKPPTWEPADPAYEVRILDISASGMRLKSGAMPIDVGDRLRIDTAFLEIPALPHLDARIVRNLHPDDPDTAQAGIQFLDRNDKTTNRLLDWLFELQRRLIQLRRAEEKDDL